MTDMFLERQFDSPQSAAGMLADVNKANDCLGLHRVAWIRSHLAIGGGRALCWFRAPDMESARIAMRQTDTDIRVFWRGSIHDKPGLDEQAIATANVLVERQFDQDTSMEEIQAIEDAGIQCLEARNVEFLRTYCSADRQRMICLYNAPDAESVRQAQREARVPFTEIWAFSTLNPADFNDINN